MIYTIGYQTLTPAKLARTLKALGAVLIDVRSSPRTRIAGFGNRQLETLLGEGYIGRPDLGGRAPITKAAINSLRKYDGEDAPNCVLMCMEDSPAACHRHHEICGPHFPSALHILGGHLLTAASITTYCETDAQPGIVGRVA